MNVDQSRTRMRPRTVAMLVITGLVLAAGLVGAAIDRMFSRARPTAATLPDTGYHPLSAVLRSPTDEQRRRVRAELARELELAPEQVPIVDSILDARSVEFRALRDEIRPRVERLTNSVRADVERVLTPAQRERYRMLLGPARANDDSMRASR